MDPRHPSGGNFAMQFIAIDERWAHARRTETHCVDYSTAITASWGGSPLGGAETRSTLSSVPCSENKKPQRLRDSRWAAAHPSRLKHMLCRWQITENKPLSTVANDLADPNQNLHWILPIDRGCGKDCSARPAGSASAPSDRVRIVDQKALLKARREISKRKRFERSNDGRFQTGAAARR